MLSDLSHITPPAWRFKPRIQCIGGRWVCGYASRKDVFFGWVLSNPVGVGDTPAAAFEAHLQQRQGVGFSPSFGRRYGYGLRPWARAQCN